MKNKLKRIVSMLLCAMLLCGLLPLAATAGDTGAVEQKLYVSKNMVLWVDGANNWNGSHKTDVNLWKDISGSRNPLDLSAVIGYHEHRWEDNALFVDPAQGGLVRLYSQRIAEDLIHSYAYTVELVLGDIVWEDSASPILFRSKNGAIKLTAARNQNGTVDLTFKNGEPDGEYFAAQATVEDLSGITLAVTVDEDRNPFNSFLYVNGEKVGDGKVANFTRKDVESFLFGCTDEEGRWGGQLHGIRIYGRALTPEELAANAAADSFNYREGNVIAPVQRYDPQLDMIVCGPERLDGVSSNDRIPFNGATNMIPTQGYYGSINLLDYLYPFPSDEVLWEGARITLAEDLEQDFEGKPIPYVWFCLRYDVICGLAGLKPLSVGETQYVVLAYRASGEVDDVKMTAIAYSAERWERVAVPTEAVTDTALSGDGTGDVQYLVFEVEHESYKMTEEEDYLLTSIEVQIDGLEEDDVLYLYELSMFATEAEMCAYTGLPYDEPSTEPPNGSDSDGNESPDGSSSETNPDSDASETPNGTEDDRYGDSDGDGDGEETDTPNTHEPAVDEDVTDERTSEDSATATDADVTDGADGSDEKGCSATVGFGAVAILTAIAAAVALKKRTP